MENFNQIPDIEFYNNNLNPVISSPNSPFEISFYQTRETLMDTDTYSRFLKNAISRFRKSIVYKHYKGFLFGLGMDHCQFHGEISDEMATLEMHHNMLTIYDIAIIITEHTLKTQGMISTFDLVELLRQEHINHRVQLVMLSLTPHQLYHNNPDFFIHPDMCFGNWCEFLNLYNKGITQDIAFKVLFYLKRAIEEGHSNDADLLQIRDRIMDWSYLNQFE